VPSTGFALVDATAMLAWLLVATVALIVGFVFLAVRLAREHPEPRVVRCPAVRTRAVVVVLRRRHGHAGTVGYCSHWSTGRAAGCDRACLTRAA